MELKVMVEGIQRIVCGVTNTTTCQDVVYALAHATGKTGRFTLMEKWRNNEKLLAPQDHPLRVLAKWGEHASDVQLILKRTPLDPKNSAGKKAPHDFLHGYSPPNRKGDEQNRSNVSGDLNSSQDESEHYARSSLMHDGKENIRKDLDCRGEKRTLSPNGDGNLVNGVYNDRGRRVSPYQEVGKSRRTPDFEFPGSQESNNDRVIRSPGFGNRYETNPSRGENGIGRTPEFDGNPSKGENGDRCMRTPDYELGDGAMENRNPRNVPRYRKHRGDKGVPYQLKSPPPFRAVEGTEHGRRFMDGEQNGEREASKVPQRFHERLKQESPNSSSASQAGGGYRTPNQYPKIPGYPSPPPYPGHRLDSVVRDSGSLSDPGSKNGQQNGHIPSLDAPPIKPSRGVNNHIKSKSVHDVEFNGIIRTNPPDGKEQERVVFDGRYRDLVKLVNLQREKLDSQSAELTQYDAELGYWEERHREKERQLELIEREMRALDMAGRENEGQMNGLDLKAVEGELNQGLQQENSYRCELTNLRNKLSKCEADLHQCVNTISRMLVEQICDEQKLVEEDHNKREASLLEDMEQLKVQIEAKINEYQTQITCNEDLETEMKQLEESILIKRGELDTLIRDMKEANLESLSISPAEEVRLLLDGCSKRAGSGRKMIGSPRQLENALPTSKNPHGVWV